MTCLLLSAVLLGAAPQTSGDEFFRKGNYAEAVTAFEATPPPLMTPDILNSLGMSYHFLSRFQDAERAYRQGLRLDSDNVALHNNLGALFYSQRKFGDADGEFRRAAENNGDNTTLHRNLRASRYARDNSRAALARAMDLSVASPLLVELPAGSILPVVSLLPEKTLQDAAMHELRGDSYSARKLYDDAVIEYRRALSLDRYNAAAANRLGIAYHHLRKYREAEQQYRDALRYRPNFLDAEINLGVIYYVQGDYDAAMNRYNRAYRLHPDSVTLLGNMGACLFSMERWEEGVRAYQQALALNPDLFAQRAAGAGPVIQMSIKATSMMNFHFAKIFAERGETDVAISYLYKAIENGLDDADLLRDEKAFKPLAKDERFVRMIQTMEGGRSGI